MKGAGDAQGTVMHKGPQQKKARPYKDRKNPVQLQWNENQVVMSLWDIRGNVFDGGNVRDVYVRLNPTSELTGFVNSKDYVSNYFPIFN